MRQNPRTRLGRLGTAIFAVCLTFAPFAAVAAPVQTNDTFLPRQWYLDSIGAREGWNTATGSRDVIVAVIDSGVDITHPDLKDRIWTNPDETPGNKIDDDEDGYVDDIHGWNFITDTPDVRPIASSQGIPEAWVHGTVVASLIAAAGNDNIGISGVAWQARIMPLVALGPDGYGSDPVIIEAIRYAVAHGADIINLSLVGYDFNADLDQAIREATAQGVLVVSAAGNSDTDPRGENLDGLPGYPACDKGAAGRGSLTVSALTQDGKKARYANYGSCVDVSAPGEEIFAARPITDPNGAPTAGYLDHLDGTSVAAPLVSGLAVLLKSEHPDWSASELAARIIATADPSKIHDPNFDKKLGSGEIDVTAAIADDPAARALGPLHLFAAAPGLSPEVRVIDEAGDEVSRFMVSNAGDLRGVRASFIRWQGQAEPDIAISMIGDPRGAWRIYRPDGLLIAAGEAGTDIHGGVYLAAQDLTGTGADDLFLGEADGRRAWIVTTSSTEAFTPLQDLLARGVLPLSIARPVPSFLVLSKDGPVDALILGPSGHIYASSQVSTSTMDGRIARRAVLKGGGSVYDLGVNGANIVFVGDASGLHVATENMTVDRFLQIPTGLSVGQGWVYYETWPR